MNANSVLITGGAGFVGSHLALAFRRSASETRVTALDNLKRRGSELNLPRLAAAGVQFRHGDVRCPEDFAELPDFDLLVDASAEPAVQAGQNGSPRYVLETNLAGTINCLEAARARGAAFLFLSTSRVYPIARLNALPHVETETRFHWQPEAALSDGRLPGFSEHGIAEEFPLNGARSFYGASKLACEQLIEEYVQAYRMPALVDRCGLLAGPWQMGKTDQGVVSLWVARHYFERPLSYLGFGGGGKQVRDILHVEDLCELVLSQAGAIERWDGRAYNVGGGAEAAVSLQELTSLCAAETGRRVPIAPVAETADVDLRIFVTDARKVRSDFNWQPRRTVAHTVRDICLWIHEHRDSLAHILP